MRAKYIILLAACSIALLAARAERPLFQAELDVTNAVEYIAGQAYRVDGRVIDRSVLGYVGDSVRVGDLVFTESILGDVDAWRVTNIVFASALHVRLDVAYLPDGETNGIGGMPIGPAALCTIATNTDIGFPQPPSETGAALSAHLLNEIRSYSFRLIPGTWHDYGLGEVVTNLAFELATTTGQVASIASDVAALPQGATIAAGDADSVTRSGTNLVITWNTNAAGGGGSGDASLWYEYPAAGKVALLGGAIWNDAQYPEQRALTNFAEVVWNVETWTNVFDASENYATAELHPDGLGNISDGDFFYFETFTNVDAYIATVFGQITSMVFRVTGRLEIGGCGVWCPIKLFRDVWGGGWGEWVALDGYTIESNEWQTLVYPLDCSADPINMAIGERPVLSFGYGPSHHLPPNEKLYIREIALVSVNGLPIQWQIGVEANGVLEMEQDGETRFSVSTTGVATFAGDVVGGGVSLADTLARATAGSNLALIASNLAASAYTEGTGAAAVAASVRADFDPTSNTVSTLKAQFDGASNQFTKSGGNVGFTTVTGGTVSVRGGVSRWQLGSAELALAGTGPHTNNFSTVVSSNKVQFSQRGAIPTTPGWYLVTACPRIKGFPSAAGFYMVSYLTKNGNIFVKNQVFSGGTILHIVYPTVSAIAYSDGDDLFQVKMENYWVNTVTNDASTEYTFDGIYLWGD